MGRKGQYISFRRDMTMFVGPTIIANDNWLAIPFPITYKNAKRHVYGKTQAIDDKFRFFAF